MNETNKRIACFGVGILLGAAAMLYACVRPIKAATKRTEQAIADGDRRVQEEHARMLDLHYFAEDGTAQLAFYYGKFGKTKEDLDQVIKEIRNKKP